jgi:hypothetical protein
MRDGALRGTARLDGTRMPWWRHARGITADVDGIWPMARRHVAWHSFHYYTRVLKGEVLTISYCLQDFILVWTFTYLSKKESLYSSIDPQTFRRFSNATRGVRPPFPFPQSILDNLGTCCRRRKSGQPFPKKRLHMLGHRYSYWPRLSC